MSILVDEKTRVLVQGMTGSEGSFHTRGMIEYGTNVVAGVTPGKRGQVFEDKPLFNTVEKAVKETGANASVIFVPSQFASDAIIESSAAGIELVVCITEGVPVVDMVKVFEFINNNEFRLKYIDLFDFEEEDYAEWGYYKRVD